MYELAVSEMENVDSKHVHTRAQERTSVEPSWPPCELLSMNVHVQQEAACKLFSSVYVSLGAVWEHGVVNN
jgi:hypothetical protein